MKNTLYIIAAVALPIMANAQQDTLRNTINRDVEVVNNYLPTISNPFKLQVDPAIDDTMSYKATFKYETLNKVQTVKTNPDSLSAASMHFKPEEMPYHAWVKGGVGNYGNFIAQLVYNIGAPNDKYHLDLNLGNKSMLGKIKLKENDEKVKAPTTNSWVRADFATFFAKKNALDVNLKFRNYTYRYYGYQTINDTALYNVNYLLDGTTKNEYVKGNLLKTNDNQRQTTFDGRIGFGNRLVDPRDKFTYNVALGLGIFNNKTGVRQTDILGNVNFRIPFKTHYFIDGIVDVNSNIINVVPDDDYNQYIYNFRDRKHTDIQLRPHFGIDYDFFQLRAGVNFILEFGDDEDAPYMQPDFFADFNVSDGAVTLYLGLTGNYKANTFRQLAEENPWIASDASNYVWVRENNSYVEKEMQTTQNPIRMTAGIRAKIGRVVAFNICADYSSFDDELFFINKGYYSENQELSSKAPEYSDYSNMFGVISENGKVGKLSCELNITPASKSEILLKGSYYKWKLDYLEEPWYKPKYEMGVDLRLYPIEKLLLTAGVNCKGKRYGYNHHTRAKEELDMLLDINLGAEYRINSRLTAFLNVNNVAAQDYQRWIGYSSERLNCLGGVTFKF